MRQGQTPKGEILKRIHVNQLVIRHNKKYGNKLPAIRIEDDETRQVTYCMAVDVVGPSRLVYNPDNPLACGAKLWIETEAKVKPEGRVPYSRIAKRMKALAQA